VHELFTTAVTRDRGELDHTGLLTVVEELSAILARTAD
jgi:hypothetical protein